MSEKTSTFDHVRDIFEQSFPDRKVAAVIDYSDQHVVVVVKNEDEEMHVSSNMYKIDRRTGETSVFVPTENIHQFNEALAKRSKQY